MTSYHVVADAKELAVIMNDGTQLPATFVGGDPGNDVALLKVEGSTQGLSVTEGSSVNKGDDVFTLGYPLIQVQGQEQKATFGRVNALTGVKGDFRFFQIDLPAQPGNSGGPLINAEGQVIGIVTATLDVVATWKAAGALPQNVNYAVKSDYVIPILVKHVGARLVVNSRRGGQPSPSDLVRLCEGSVVLVIAR